MLDRLVKPPRGIAVFCEQVAELQLGQEVSVVSLRAQQQALPSPSPSRSPSLLLSELVPVEVLVLWAFPRLLLLLVVFLVGKEHQQG